MLWPCQDLFEVADLFTLEPSHLGCSHSGPEVGVFAGALDHAAPARVPRYVDHGRESPMDPNRSCLTRRHCLGSFDHLGAPRRRHRDRYREDGAQAVDDVEAEQQGDAMGLPSMARRCSRFTSAGSLTNNTEPAPPRLRAPSTARDCSSAHEPPTAWLAK